MGADQIAEIRPAIAEVFAGVDAGENWCATFTVSGDPDRWVQVTADSVNTAYPYREDPAEAVVPLAIATSLQLTQWQAGSYATFHFEAGIPARELARMVDVLFSGLLRAPSDYSVDVEIVPLSNP
jgi:hypothetical protein